MAFDTDQNFQPTKQGTVTQSEGIQAKKQQQDLQTSASTVRQTRENRQKQEDGQGVRLPEERGGYSKLQLRHLKRDACFTSSQLTQRAWHPTLATVAACLQQQVQESQSQHCCCRAASAARNCRRPTRAAAAKDRRAAPAAAAACASWPRRPSSASSAASKSRRCRSSARPR